MGLRLSERELNKLLEKRGLKAGTGLTGLKPSSRHPPPKPAVEPVAGTVGKEICRLVLPIDPYWSSQNGMESLHHTQKGRRRKAVARTAHAVWYSAGRPRSDSRVRISVVVRRGITLDDDNVWSGLKPVRDALFNGAITPRDSAKWVQIGACRMETGAKFGARPEVEMLVEVAEPLQGKL